MKMKMKLFEREKREKFIIIHLPIGIDIEEEKKKRRENVMMSEKASEGGERKREGKRKRRHQEKYDNDMIILHLSVLMPI